MRIAYAFCNSGLIEIQAGKIAGVGGIAKPQIDAVGAVIDRRLQGRQAARRADQFDGGRRRMSGAVSLCHGLFHRIKPLPARRLRERWARQRSEEHTSELQSLMRISYAVFCLKKKTTQRMQSTQQK